MILFITYIIGGPYIILGATPANDIQVGITSFGVGCAQKAFPDISTRVSFFNDWISCVLNGTCTDTNYSTRPPDSNNPAGSGDVYLPGPTAIVNVTLTTDINPGETTVLALNLCDGVKSFMLEGLQSANTEYTESLTVSNGGYIFATVDQSKDGKYADLCTFTSAPIKRNLLAKLILCRVYRFWWCGLFVRWTSLVFD